MRTEPGSELMILRQDITLLAERIEALKKELQTALRYCSKAYWTDGHGDRVRDTYGIDASTPQD